MSDVVSLEFDPTLCVHVYDLIGSQPVRELELERLAYHWVHALSFVSSHNSHFGKTHEPCGNATFMVRSPAAVTIPIAPLGSFVWRSVLKTTRSPLLNFFILSPVLRLCL